MAAWLRRRIAESDRDAEDEDRSRRLESDAEAVQVLTIHRSKGLEFPIVYCPYLWDGYSPQPEVPVFHDPDHGDVRTVDVGREGPGFAIHCQQHVFEQRGEDLRLLYVALTRARNQAVIWWAGTHDSGQSPLGRLLFTRDGEGNVAPFAGRAPSDAEVAGRVHALCARSAGAIGLERVIVESPVAWKGADSTPPLLRRATFGRSIDEQWRRTSYTAISSGTHEALVASEPEEGLVSDEELAPEVGSPAPSGADNGVGNRLVPTATVASAGEAEEGRLRAATLLLGGMPGGTQVGTAIHRVLEATDFAARDLASELRARLEAELARRPLDLGDVGTVMAGLCAVVESPLGPLARDIRLRDIRRGDRLDELTFELPLAGGDTPMGELSVSDIAALLGSLLPAGDGLAAYAARLADPALDRPLRGYLTGSLDLVMRLPGERFVVVDYKTNRVGDPGGGSGAWPYRPDGLRREMERAHYPLQALLYAVALHRYLRWRLPAYAPERHLAGVLYLFLRGMSSPEHPRVGTQPCGVWSWAVPAGVVTALSDLLERGVVAA